MFKLISCIILISYTYSQKSVLVTSTMTDDKYLQFEKEFTEEIIKIYNIKNDLNLKIEYKDIHNLDNLFTVKNDDILQFSIYAWTITQDRLKKYLISKPYLFSSSVIMALKNKNNSTQRLGIVKKSSHEQYRAKLTAYKLVEFNNFEEMYTAVDSGEVDAIISDLSDYWSRSDKYKLVTYVSKKNIEKYGVLFPKDSKYFNKFNKAFNYYVDSIKFLKLLRKHFGQEAVYFYNKSLAK